jgi:CheY-like chemotaxis protein
MKNGGPIIVIEDDPDDRYIMGVIFARLNYANKIIYFPDGVEAFDYLNSCEERPFLIISDINMPILSGFELKEMINSNEKLRLKCTPYIFLSTSSSRGDIIKAYSNCAQGFFRKPPELEQLAMAINKIVEYWDESLVPGV